MAFEFKRPKTPDIKKLELSNLKEAKSLDWTTKAIPSTFLMDEDKEDLEEDNLSPPKVSPILGVPKLDFKSPEHSSKVMEVEFKMPKKSPTIKINQLNLKPRKDSQQDSPRRRLSYDDKTPILSAETKTSSPGVQSSSPKGTEKTLKKARRKVDKQIESFLEELEQSFHKKIRNNEGRNNSLTSFVIEDIQQDTYERLESIARQFLSKKAEPPELIDKLQSMQSAELNKTEKILAVKLQLILSSISRLQEYYVKIFYYIHYFILFTLTPHSPFPFR